MDAKTERLSFVANDIKTSLVSLRRLGAILTKELKRAHNVSFSADQIVMTLYPLQHYQALVEVLVGWVGDHAVSGDAVEKDLQMVLGGPDGERIARATIDIQLAIRSQLVRWEDSLAQELSDQLPMSLEATQQRVTCQLVTAFCYQAEAVAKHIAAILPLHYLHFWVDEGFHYVGEPETQGARQ
jgi:hypothetical protein